MREFEDYGIYLLERTSRFMASCSSLPEIEKQELC